MHIFPAQRVQLAAAKAGQKRSQVHRPTRTANVKKPRHFSIRERTAAPTLPPFGFHLANFAKRIREQRAIALHPVQQAVHRVQVLIHRFRRFALRLDRTPGAERFTRHVPRQLPRARFEQLSDAPLHVIHVHLRPPACAQIGNVFAEVIDQRTLSAVAKHTRRDDARRFLLQFTHDFIQPPFGYTLVRGVKRHIFDLPHARQTVTAAIVRR